MGVQFAPFIPQTPHAHVSGSMGKLSPVVANSSVLWSPFMLRNPDMPWPVLCQFPVALTVGCLQLVF